MNFLIHTIDRKQLTEGRNIGLAIGLAEKVKINNATSFILKTGMSCCKDYLNDVVAVEKSKIKEGLVYGFNYKKNSFKIKETNILLFRAEAYSNIVKLKDDNIVGYLKNILNFKYFENLENVKYIINRIESEVFNLKEKKLSTFEVIKDYISNDDKEYAYPIVVANFNKFWLNNQIGISLYSVLVRRALCINKLSEEEKKLPILDFIEMISKKNNLGEGFELTIFKKLTFEELNAIFNNNLKNLSKLLGYSKINNAIHNYGVSSFLHNINTNKDNVFKILDINIINKNSLKNENTANNNVVIDTQPQGVQLNEINGGTE